MAARQGVEPQAEVGDEVADRVEDVLAVLGGVDVDDVGVDRGDPEADPDERRGQQLDRVGTAADLDPQDPGALHQLLDGAGHDQPPGVDHHDVVADPLDVVEQVGGEQDRDAEGGQAADEVEHLLPAHRVEAGGGLVEQDQLGVGHQGLGQLGALAHAGREAADRPEPGLVEADQVEHVGGPLAGGLGGQAGQLAEGGDQVGRGLVEGQAVVLGHVPQAGPDPDGVVGHRTPDHLEAAGGRVQLAQHQPEERRLARAVGPDQADRAPGDVHRQLVQRGGPAGIGEGEGLGPQQRLARRARGRRHREREERGSSGEGR